MGGNGKFMREGWRYILPVWGLTLIVLIFSDSVVLNLLLIVASFFIAYLFYIPERTPFETSPEAILSPIDGTVLSIQNRDGVTAISLRKSIFDGSSAVRAPFTGDISEKKIVHGLFMGGDEKLAERLNEKGYIRWRAGKTEVEMKIRCGFFSFGVLFLASERRSEAADVVAHLSDGVVELLLPGDVRSEVSPGERVVGGYSLLAYGTE